MPTIALHRAGNADTINGSKLSQPSGVFVLRVLAQAFIESAGQISSGVFGMFTCVQIQDVSQRRIGRRREQAEAVDRFEPRIHERLRQFLPTQVAEECATPDELE